MLQELAEHQGAAPQLSMHADVPVVRSAGASTCLSQAALAKVQLCILSMASTVLQELAEKLRHEDRENGRGRKWRTNYNKLNAQLLALENDHHALELVHPQVNHRRGAFDSHEPAIILRCQSAQHHIEGPLT